ncbi:MAG: methylenetetrahydrofolate reductase [Acidaminococcaceae bacterium]|nr:methylenetetrahydrofolate reductase [Acidaminococcaceae bacterium]HBX75969.1 methylenetetrahydrofolate reductase [NAD(P)H] [Acidaminococcaceae bacterium]
MKIIDHLKERRAGISCELFPPKKGTELANALEIVHTIAEKGPSFISVTYGAGGSNVGQAVAVAAEVKKCGVPSMAHLTCINADESSIEAVLEQMRTNGIDNILALRGDLPEGQTLEHAEYQHASDLAKKIKSFGDFCVGGACYPEGHPESANLNDDIEKLKIKVDNGVEFLVTQMFFDNDVMYNYMYRLLAHGITVPVVPGVMPVTNAKQIQHICKLSGTKLPLRFRAIVEKYGNDPEAMKQAGINYAVAQVLDLLANGFMDVHVYTMNKPDIIGGILDNLSCIVKR